jgi:hypothetical protein
MDRREFTLSIAKGTTVVGLLVRFGDSRWGSRVGYMHCSDVAQRSEVSYLRTLTDPPPLGDNQP